MLGNIKFYIVLAVLFLNNYMLVTASELYDYEKYGGGCCLLNEWCSGEFEFTGEVLYWQPLVIGIPYALTFNQETTTLLGEVPNHITIKNVEFDFSPGFRLGTAYVLPCSKWDVNVYWTHFRASANDSVQAGGGVLIATLWDALTVINPSSASAEMTTKLDYVDIDIGKTLNFCGCFSFRPFLGARYYRLNVKEDIDYRGITAQGTVQAVQTNIQLTNFIRGWGISVGENACWHLPCGFGIYNNNTIATMLSNFTLSQDQQVILPDSPADNFDLSSTSHLRSVKAIITICIGVNWEKDFCCNNFPMHLNLFAGYEFDYFLTQIQMTRAIQTGSLFADAVPSNTGSIGFRGLTVGATLQF
jgi:Legionella pneumophila major outer membrane protein precursor